MFVAIILLLWVIVLSVFIVSQEKYRDKCLKVREEEGTAINGCCGGLPGGDRHTDFLSYDCVDCPYLNLGGEHE